ncbi:MAG: PP2C family protein-serine/threonine phosphatase [Thermoanaerobaculia bacterium]
MKGHARDALISAAVGVGIVYLVTVNEAQGPRWGLSAYGALLGFFAYVFCAGLTWILRGWLARLPGPGWLPRSVLYFIGGAAAFLLANRLGSALGLVNFQVTFEALRAYLPVAGAIGVLVGLLFYAFGLLQGRLRTSVERLKEAEFAEKELELARSIQQRILPPEELSGRGYRIRAKNLAAQFVAGDFYDVFQLPDGAVGVVVADVAGKGIGASLIMATVKAALPFLAADRSVEEALREANRRLAPQLEAREFVALTYARYEPSTGAYTVANAGLPDPYVLSRDGSVRAISALGPRFPLGVRDEVAYERIGGVLAPGERLMLLTDGLPEAITVEGAPLGYEAFERLLARGSDPDVIFEAVRAATGRSLTDDWTVLVLERTA